MKWLFMIALLVGCRESHSIYCENADEARHLVEEAKASDIDNVLWEIKKAAKKGKSNYFKDYELQADCLNVVVPLQARDFTAMCQKDVFTGFWELIVSW